MYLHVFTCIFPYEVEVGEMFVGLFAKKCPFLIFIHSF